jgi:hypothetical protein
MKGMKAKLTSSETANDPDSRINKSLRAWNCRAGGGRLMDDDIMHALRIAQNRMGYDNGGTAANPAPAADMSGADQDDQDYSNYINQMLTNLTNNSNFNTPPAMPAPQIDVAQMSAPNPTLAMPPAPMMNRPPSAGMGGQQGQGGSQPFSPPSPDLSSRFANAGFNQQQVNSIMQILQGGQQGQGAPKPFAPAPMMPGQGIAPNLAMPPQGGFPMGAGVQNNPAMPGAAASPSAAPAPMMPPMPGQNQ